ncbi:MAG: hypothetical protein CVV27_09795 [Candidatus Melainabacteria bacterium HGW-Melainabacteria-1]|nr:MAG: hypothetical protein CVV27_09795 [Candidatus Melainabacteria bacterium HGW-Melainabacteria-1]
MPKIQNLILAGLIAVSLSACEKKIPIEEDPIEHAKATAVAEKYLKAFAGGDAPLVMEMSEAPFWGDGDIVPTMEALEIEVKEQLKDISDLEFVVKDARYLPMAELQQLMPNLYQQLVGDQFITGVHAVVLTLEIMGKEERGLVLVRRQEDGMWKVVGIGD